MITAHDTITGVLSSTSTISGGISAQGGIAGMIQLSGELIPPIYDGEYEVTPKAFNDIVLATKDKKMEDDVTVFKVPYYETSNVTGETVYIASEV